MKHVIVLAVCLLSFNSFAESFSARCALRGFDKNTQIFIPGSIVQPVLVTVDENHSVKLGEMAGFSFEARSAGDGVQATAVDLESGAVINPIVVDGSKYSIVQVDVKNVKIVMDCTKASH